MRRTAGTAEDAVRISQFVILSLGVLLCAQAPARADLIYLNEEGQAHYGRGGGKLEGVIRRFNNEIFEWQPYTKGWEWDKDLIIIKWAHIQRAVHEIDTKADVGRFVRSVLKRLDPDRLRAEARGETHLPEMSPAFIVRSILENYTRFVLTNEEADPGVSEFALEQLKTLLTWFDRPDPATKGTPAYDLAAQRALFGTEARKNLLEIFVNAQRAIADPSFAAPEGAVDPRIVAYVSLRLIPDVTWKLSYKDYDLRGQHEAVARVLLNICATPPGGRNDYPVIFEAKKQLQELCKNSERGREYLVSEFGRSEDSYRQAVAAWILVDNGASDERTVRLASKFVIRLIQSQPDPETTSCATGIQVLQRMMREHTVAREEVEAAVRRLSERVASDRAAKSDLLVKGILERLLGRGGAG